MTPFFRKIRKTLADDNKPIKYFRYAIGEIVLVVIGILIALQINTWNDNRKLENIKQNYYQQLLSDLETDINYAKEVISYLDSANTKYNKYLEIYKEYNVSIDKIHSSIGINNFQAPYLEFKTSTIESLINTGDIKLFEPDLRKKLTTFNGSKTETLSFSKMFYDNANSVLASASMSGAGFEDRLQNHPELSNSLDFENRLPEIIFKLEAYLGWRNTGDNDVMTRLNLLIEEADIIIEIITKELEK